MAGVQAPLCFIYFQKRNSILILTKLIRNSVFKSAISHGGCGSANDEIKYISSRYEESISMYSIECYTLCF